LLGAELAESARQDAGVHGGDLADPAPANLLAHDGLSPLREQVDQQVAGESVGLCLQNEPIEVVSQAAVGGVKKLDCGLLGR
jgi:hypothetical protein